MNHVTGQPDLRKLVNSTFDFRVKRASEGMFMSSVRSLMSFGSQTVGLGGVLGSTQSQGQDLDDSQYGSIVEINDRRDVSHGFFMQSSSDRWEQEQSSRTTSASAATTPVMKHSDSFGQFILASTVSTTTLHRLVTASTAWHETRSPDDKDKWVGCGNFSLPKDYKGVVCTPQPNAFNPCEDVMGYEWLRVFVWFVLLAALCGNFIVIIVLITARSKLTVPKFLMCNLSFADFLMGFYLLLIASVDIHSLGEYFTYAVSWQNDGGCQVAGFLTVFSSELSVFVLTVITMERWYAISQAIHVNKRLRMRQAMSLIFVGWVFASVLAILPLIGVSSYGAVSMCLPMEAKDVVDTTYIISLLLFNGIAFVIICGCYVSMFLKVRASENMSRSNDATIAKRMAILVLTNFICWAPIAFFGFTASFGLPLIDITNSKILLVFFYPFNSCANPFLYAILTKQFRKDLFILLGRYGFCTDRANKYKGTSITRSYSNSRHNGLQLNVTHNHATDISILTQHRKSSRGSAVSQNGTPPQGSRGSFPKTTPQSTPQETPTTSPNIVNSPSKDEPTRLFFSNPTELKTAINERKLSTVIETIHTSDGLADDGGGCALIIASNKCDERVLEARDSLRDFFDGNPHGRVRSASEYVVIFKTSCPGQQQQQLEPQSRRGSRRSNPFERQTSKDTVISSNTLSSYISDMSSSRFDSDFDSRSVDRRLSPASFQIPSNFEKRDSGFSDVSQENTSMKCRNRSSKLKDVENISETEMLLHKTGSNVSERHHDICDSKQRATNFKDANNILSVDSIDEEETDNTGNIQYDKINAKTSRKLYEGTAVFLSQDPDDYANSDDTDDDIKARQFLLFER